MPTPNWKELYKQEKHNGEVKEIEIQALTSHLVIITEQAKATGRELIRFMEIAEKQAIEIKELKSIK